MTKPNTDGGWLLPTVIDPPTRIGVCVPVPDEPEHRQAFLGALLQLARWWNWQRDELKRGREVANVWMGIWRDVLEQLQEAEGCETMPFDVRQNEDEPCVLEKTEDGDTWIPWADLRLCPPAIRQLSDGSLEYSTDGGETWQPIGSQAVDPLYTNPPPQKPRPESAPNRSCAAARNAALVYVQFAKELASVIEDSGAEFYFIVGQFTLIVQNLLNFNLSASYFNNLSSNTAFQLNAISYLTTLWFDAAAANQMAWSYLRGAVDDPSEVEAIYCAFYCASDGDGNIDYDDALDRLSEAVTLGNILPAVKGLIELMGRGGLASAASAQAIVVTDADCADCDCQDEWCYYFDFSVNNGEFVVQPALPYGTWSSGWQSVGGLGGRVLFIQRSVPIATRVTGFSASFQVNSNNNGGGNNGSAVLGSTNVFSWGSGNYRNGLFTLDWEGVLDVNAGDLILWNQGNGSGAGNGTGGTFTLQAITIRGRGVNPFGDDNCP